MKILTIHADYIEFEAKKKAFAKAEEGIKEGKQRVEECLVVFSAVEKRDEVDLAGVEARYCKEVEDIAGQVKASKIVLYPYAHLSNALAAPQFAEEFLKKVEKMLSGKYKVFRAPFGWYKSFTVSCKGHPLSELSREFGPESKEEKKSETAGLKREAKDESFVMEEKKLGSAEKVRLSAALLSAAVLRRLYPTAKMGGCGFYQDQAFVDMSGLKLKNEDLPRIEKEVAKAISQGASFAKVAVKEVTGTLQQEIVHDLGTKASGYKLNDFTFTSQYKDPFVGSLKEIGAFKIVHLASAYWKNNANNEQLTRLYVVAFGSVGEMEKWMKEREDAENRSHLKIGKEMGLFVVSELVGPGLPLLAPRGMIIRQEIINYLWSLHKDKGYQQVWTPHIARDLLYKTSGHWDKFGDELFKVKGKVDDFVLKPMNCPHHMQIYDAFNHSYKDMPVRFFEPATVYRDEKSGQLTGLSRVRAITQDDGHLFCRVSQITQEVGTIVGVISEFYHTLGMDTDYWVSLSVRGEDKSKYLGTDEVWKTAEAALEKAAKEHKLPYKKREGEAAFYGPKLDFMFKDALGREWQLSTIQCDFNLPERFNLSYMNEEGKKERPVVIHRAISGSLERFMSVLIEHFAGKFPLWLNPVQVKVVTVNDSHKEFAASVAGLLRRHDLRVEVDDRVESIGKKVRDAQMERVNYIVTVGDKEVTGGVLAVRSRRGEVRFDVPVDAFVKELCKERDERRV